MNVVLQIPITDLRRATPAAQVKLANPSWPLPKLNKRPFIRHFGHVQKREQGGIDEWTGEEFFCNATHALQYTDLHKQIFTVDDQTKVRLQNRGKRFFSDGRFMNKIELALKDDSAVQTSNCATNVNLVSLLKHYMSLPVTVNKKPAKLYKAGPLLSALYYAATMRHNQSKTDLSNLVQDGEPCLLAIFRENEKFVLPQEAKLVNTFYLADTKEALRLYGYTLHLNGYYIKAWLLCIPATGFGKDDPAYALLRNLRINLMRIHAEKETIKAILNAAQLQLIDVAGAGTNSSLILDYLKDTSETLFKKNRYNIEQKTVLDFALRSENTASPGDFASLEKEIDKFTFKNIQKFIDRSTPKDKKTILFLCASPDDKNPINFGTELKVIQDMLERSADRASYEDIKIRTDVTRTELQEILAKIKPDILHITMHGSATLGLYFQDALGKSSPMDADEWFDVINVQSKIRKPQIIVLSVCNSYQHAERAKPHCTFVAGTKTVFPVEAGIAYATGFYSILFNDERTGPETCHQAGVDAIKHFKPAFAPINNMDVCDIICMC